MNILVLGKYLLVKKVGYGSFGEIFIARNIQTNQKLALKLEDKQSTNPQLLHEFKVYNILSPHYGIPIIYEAGMDGDYNVLAMQGLGPSTEDLFVMCGNKFTITTVCMLGIQMIQRLEYFHSRYLIHRDIKPENFLFGLDPQSQQLSITMNMSGTSELSQSMPISTNLTATGSAEDIQCKENRENNNNNNFNVTQKASDSKNIGNGNGNGNHDGAGATSMARSVSTNSANMSNNASNSNESLKPHQIVYLIDFGLAKNYYNPKTKQHNPFREKQTLTGTARYASVNAHMGLELSRRDDLLSLGYVLVYFMKGNLPWQGIQAQSKAEKYKAIFEKKKTTTTETLCHGLPELFLLYFKHCNSLQFEEAPNYSYLKSLFNDFLVQNGQENNGLYDWVIKKYKIVKDEEEKRRKNMMAKKEAN